MTNKLEAVKAIIRTRLLSAGIKRNITYPDDIHSIGNYFPMAIIESDRADHVTAANMLIDYDYYVNIYVLTQAGITPSKIHEDMVYACLNAIYVDNDMGGTAYSVNPVGIKFNAQIPYIMDSAIQNAIQVSMFQFQIKMIDTRYQ